VRGRGLVVGRLQIAVHVIELVLISFSADCEGAELFGW
jgi:hypothetical protein